MNDLRTKEMSEKYKTFRDSGGLDNGCRLCATEAKQTFKYWKIITNDFPYDRIEEIHDMILPIRHIEESDLNNEELTELKKIKEEYFSKNYDFIIEAAAGKKTIPKHHHLHLIIAKD